MLEEREERGSAIRRNKDLQTPFSPTYPSFLLWGGNENSAGSILLQCVAVCCSVLQCVAVCCSVLQCVVVQNHILLPGGNDWQARNMILPCFEIINFLSQRDLTIY